VRAAALLLSVIVTVPFAVFFFHTGHPVLIAITFNMLLATAGMVLSMLRNHETFCTFIVSITGAGAASAGDAKAAG
jgi:predicted signal transduction protein with EAL and GGDEF domain